MKMANRPQKFANQAEVSANDAPLLDSPTGREDHRGLTESGSIPAGEIAKHPEGGRPRSEITGRHDAGSGANETIDGLNSSEESLRKGAEDVPLGAEDKPIEDIPVFDRAGRLPRV
jgi:hypothetical protein